MSKDFVAFDPTGLDPVPPKEALMDWIQIRVGPGEEAPEASSTKAMEALVAWAADTYGADVGAESTWASWPPAQLADGRYCTFTLGLGADAMTFMMLLSDQCKRLGLVMIDPSGNEPFITIPGGGGLLD